MKPNTSHIKKIKVVSNTHWDREFRKSFEKTRRALLTMLDTTLDILANDPAYHSFTMDGHSIMIDDYLEMRPERRELVEKLIREGRLIVGPYYTLAEQFSISHEALVRNMMWGRKTVEKYGGKTGTVAYTPSSWGQTGQLPQILADFGLKRMMFYRGISHHEADAEYIWSAPDGTQVMASRFAVYARYNWYYQVHRAVTRDRVFEKDYIWGQYDEVPFRMSDSLYSEDPSFELKRPEVLYNKARLRQAIEDMVTREGRHFTTSVFLAMHGHDISVAHPMESRVIKDAKEVLGDTYDIEHTDLEHFWAEAEKELHSDTLPVLTGERRSYLKEGMWTFLFPGTISARTYLKQQDFHATHSLVYFGEPLCTLAAALGAEYPANYVNRGWQYLLSNHTHDANGGCAPDVVCQDMEYRYRKASDIGDIVSEDSMAYIAANLSPEGQDQDAMQLIVYNPLPFERDAVVKVDLEVPRKYGAKSVQFHSKQDSVVERQPVSAEKSSVFVDNIWEVPTILDTNKIQCYAGFHCLPALGYRAYAITADKNELRTHQSLVTSSNSMENSYLRITVNGNGTVDILQKETGKLYKNLNYLTDQGESGNAWKHVAPRYDRKYNSLGVNASVAVVERGPLVSTITAEFAFAVPADYADGQSRSQRLVDMPVKMEYTLEKDARELKVKATVNNIAKDHWLRVNMPTGLHADASWADSHYDVISRPIALPDSTGWVEEAGGTHPLRTFVDIHDGKEGLALLPKGIYEYEAFADADTTLALTLIRACRIKLAVSEEKQTELPDEGVQCPGIQRFEYAIAVHKGDWNDARLLNRAAENYTPVRCAMTGRGKGTLPQEASLFLLDNASLHVTCVKQAEDGKGLIIRLFNPLNQMQKAALQFTKGIRTAQLVKMDESLISHLTAAGGIVEYAVEPKKIRTFRIILED